MKIIRIIRHYWKKKYSLDYWILSETYDNILTLLNLSKETNKESNFIFYISKNKTDLIKPKKVLLNELNDYWVWYKYDELSFQICKRVFLDEVLKVKIPPKVLYVSLKRNKKK
jgi:hypothetical protein